MCGQKGSAGVRRIRAGRPSQTRMRAIVRAFMQSSCAVRASADGDGWAGVVRGGTAVGGIVGVSVNSPRFHGAPMRSGTPVLSNAAALEVLRTCRCPRMCRCGRLEGRGARTAWVLSGEGHGRCGTCTRSAELVYVRCAVLGTTGAERAVRMRASSRWRRTCALSSQCSRQRCLRKPHVKYACSMCSGGHGDGLLMAHTPGMEMVHVHIHTRISHMRCSRVRLETQTRLRACRGARPPRPQTLACRI
jgi:hypothetical protein